MEVLRLESLSDAERDRLIARPAPAGASIWERVLSVLKEVRSRGDAALRDHTARYDGVRLETVRVPRDEILGAWDEISEQLRTALKTVQEHIETFHCPQKVGPYEVQTATGVRAGQLVRPYGRVGIYVPQNLLSSLLMAAVPARLAGVRQLAVCTPPNPDGDVALAVRAAAALLGIEELYAVGGAQAVAALAYGTESIPPAEKIVGPGNAYVTAAKALVKGDTGIDLLAGPSEVLLMAEPMAGLSRGTLGRWALAELRAQLEHGPGTSALLLTNSSELAGEVAGGLDDEVLQGRRSAVLRYGDREAALQFVNDYAPEHLGLWTVDAEGLLERVESAGSVFLGPWSAVALGDYATGTNHVLPTAREARLTSGLRVSDFVKTISYQRANPTGLKALAPTAIALAEAEGLHEHAASVAVRLEGDRL